MVHVTKSAWLSRFLAGALFFPLVVSPVSADELVVDAPSSVIARDEGDVCFRFTVTNPGAEPVEIGAQLQVEDAQNITGQTSGPDSVGAGETVSLSYSGQLIVPELDGLVIITCGGTTLPVDIVHGLVIPAPYGWTISSSSVNPYQNTGVPTGAQGLLYLWYACCRSPLPGGMSAVEFDLESVGIEHLATTPVNGFLNAGSTTWILMAIGGCACGPRVAAELLVIDNPGTMAIVPSAVTGTKGVVDCALDPNLLPLDWIGYDSLGGIPCFKGDVDCGPIAVEATSWSKIKSFYR
jgi:hypothetical protein